MSKQTTKAVAELGGKYMSFTDDEFKDEINDIGNEAFLDNVRTLAASTVSQYEAVKELKAEKKEMQAALEKKVTVKENSKSKTSKKKSLVGFSK